MANLEKINPNEKLRTSYPKINAAIEASGKADTNALQSLSKSEQAINKADQANTKADETQVQLNNIIIESGTSDAEVIQARGGAPVLNERLNGLDVQLAEKTTGRRKLTLKDAWISWQNGDKFPVAFFGDSTIDGVNTTGHTNNVIGTDHKPPNAFTTILENLIKQHTGNVNARIYNAGFSGKTADWGYANINNIFGSTYADAKMIGIGFGINDRLVSDTETYETVFRTNVESIIEWCFDKGIQPFLLTTQAIVQPSTSYDGQYPLRDSESINSVSNRVKKELAKKYNIDLIDVNSYTENFLKNSPYKLSTVISDTLHFGDTGHKFEGELLFSLFCPRVVWVKDGELLDFSSQQIRSDIDETNVVFDQNYVSKYHKSWSYYDKVNTTDTLLLDFLVFSLDSELEVYDMLLQNKKTGFTIPTDDTQKPYIMFNTVKTIIHNEHINSYFTNYGFFMPKKIGKLNFGLNHIQKWSGDFNRVSATGFYVTKKLTENVNTLTFYKDETGTVRRNALSEYDSYVEENAIFKMELDTNIAASDGLIIPLIDKRSLGIAMNIGSNFISFLLYNTPIQNITSPSSLAVYNYPAGTNVLDSLKEFYVKITSNKLSVFQNLKDSTPLLELSISENFGAFFIAHYLHVYSNTPNNSYGTLKITRLS